MTPTRAHQHLCCCRADTTPPRHTTVDTITIRLATDKASRRAQRGPFANGPISPPPPISHPRHRSVSQPTHQHLHHDSTPPFTKRRTRQPKMPLEHARQCRPRRKTQRTRHTLRRPAPFDQPLRRDDQPAPRHEDLRRWGAARPTPHGQCLPMDPQHPRGVRDRRRHTHISQRVVQDRAHATRCH